MNTPNTNQTQFDIPDHVPPELVVPYDFAHGPEVMAFPPAALDGFRDKRAVFYSTFYGGFWVFTRYDDIRAAFQNHELFKQDQGIPRAPFNRLFIPLGLNPPEHMPYRKIMTALFSARHIAYLEPIIRGVARDQLAKLAPRGEMELASEFALTLPAASFCGQLGLPTDDFERFHRLSQDLIYRPNQIWKEKGEEAAKTARKKANDELEKVVADLIPLRQKDPGEDVISLLLTSDVNGRPVTVDEAHNMTTLLFFAGTDSTAAAISFAHAFLAKNPEHRRKVIARLHEPDFIWRVSEELIRFHGFHHMSREVTRDEVFAGVQLKKGDSIVLPTGSANRDETQFPKPFEVDFDRSNAKTHLTFGAGVHRCLGSHLATLQLRIALEEFHRVIPEYRLSGPVEYMSGGPKTTPHRVPLVFAPTAAR